MYAYTNILAALLQRGKTGKGAHIDVSMLESMVEWMSYPLYYAFDGATPPPRAGASHATIFPYGPFTAGDGKTIILGLQNEREWEAFCRVALEQVDLAADTRFASNSLRTKNRDALTQIITTAFSSLTIEEVVARLERAQIANARMNDMLDVWSHPQLKARERWTSVQSPVGEIPALLPPGMPNGFEPRMDAIPALGQHSESILRELGYTSGDVTQLCTEGAI
jgi:itaconate CoA-transferase